MDRHVTFSIAFCATILLITNSATSIASTQSELIEINPIVSPSIDGNLSDTQWLNATSLDINFTFVNGQTHQARVRLGHNRTHFFVGAIVYGIGPNPNTVPDIVTRPDGFFIYFDVDNNGELNTPEDGKGVLNFIGIWNGTVFWSASISKDSYWRSDYYPPALSDWRNRRPEVQEDILWKFDDDAGDLQNISTHGSGGYTHGFQGDQTFEFCFNLNSSDPSKDGLHLDENEQHVMRFSLEFYRQGYELENGTWIPDLYDVWPGDGFSPRNFVNASEWAKMIIDLDSQKGLPIVIWFFSAGGVALGGFVIAYLYFKKIKVNEKP